MDKKAVIGTFSVGSTEGRGEAERAECSLLHEAPTVRVACSSPLQTKFSPKKRGKNGIRIFRKLKS